MENDTLTALPGVRVGHWSDPEAATGCTVILFEAEGAVAGLDIRGGAPGTRGTEVLAPGRLVQRIDAIVLTGGSGFGLDAVGGVMRYLRERNIGFDAFGIKVPIVPAANLFDLRVGRSDRWPDAQAGYAACRAATTDPVEEGSVGAGTGATVGKILGPTHATKGGVGTAVCAHGDRLVGALVVVNAFGDVIDPESGEIIAGARQPDDTGFLDTAAALLQGSLPKRPQPPGPSLSTTLGVIATNVRFSKEEVSTVARMAYSGLARVIRPTSTLFDGDLIFAASCGKESADVNVIGQMAAEALQEAVLRAIVRAEGIHGIPAAKDLPFSTPLSR